MKNATSAQVTTLRRGHGPATLRQAALQIAFWTAVGVLFALPALSTGVAGRLPLWRSLAEWWSWGLLAPAIAAADHALPFPSRANERRLVAHAVLAIVFTAVDVHVAALMAAVIGIGAWASVWDPHLVQHALQAGFVWGLLVYGLIAGVAAAGRAQRRVLSTELRMERLQRNASEARLHALRMQLDPHFLFNALNTISAQVARDGRLARAMIEHLAELLRLSLDERTRHEVRLDEELALLEHYLAIQRLRFGDRLRIVVDVAPGAEAAIVPSLLMQPWSRTPSGTASRRGSPAGRSRSMRAARPAASISGCATTGSAFRVLPRHCAKAWACRSRASASRVSTWAARGG